MNAPPSKNRALPFPAPLLFGAGLVVLVLVGAWGLVRNGGSEGTAPPELHVPADRILAVGELSELPLSTIAIPVEYDPQRALAELETLVPRTFGGMAVRRAFPALPGAQYAFVAHRGAFHTELSGNTLRVSTEVRYGGRLWVRTPIGLGVSASCGVEGDETSPDAPRARVTFSSPVDIDPDWTLRTNVVVDPLQPVSASDRCVIEELQTELDATDVIMSAARIALAEEAARIQQILEGIDLARHVEDSWLALGRPIGIGPDTWLMLNPEHIRLEVPVDIDSEPGGITGRLEIGARPRVTLGPRPPDRSAPVPPLEPGSVAARSDGLIVDGRAGYDALSTLAMAHARGRTFRVAGRSLRIRDVRAAGLGDGRIAVELDVTEDADATVRLEGTPAYDPGDGIVSIPDLEYTVEGSRLLRMTAWAMRTFLPGYVRERTRLPVDALRADDGVLAGRDLDLLLDGDSRLRGTLGELDVTEIVATRKALIVRLRVAADARLRIGSAGWATERSTDGRGPGARRSGAFVLSPGPPDP